MPYKRSYNITYRKRRTRRSRSNGQWGKYGWHSMAKQALETAKWVATLVNVETKMISVASAAAGVAVTNVAGITPLTLCAQGTSDVTRNGNSIKAASLSLKFNIKLNATTPTSSEIRIMLVLDKVSNGTAPLITDILDQDGNTPDTIEHYNPDNAGSRFKILYDKRFTIDPNGREQFGSSAYLKLNHHVKYNDSPATIAAATTGHMYLVYVSDQSTNYPQMYYTNRFYFYDN